MTRLEGQLYVTPSGLLNGVEHAYVEIQGAEVLLVPSSSGKAAGPMWAPTCASV